MRFYGWDRGDIGNCIERSHFDAEHGRVKLALERLQDISSVLPDEPELLYEEALIKSQFLGQGVVARDLFARSYKLASEQGISTDLPAKAAYESFRFARNADEFRFWVDILRVEDPDYKSEFSRLVQQFNNGTPYWEFLISSAEAQSRSGAFGTSAAILEIALYSGVPSDREAILRRFRSQYLRELDQKAQSYRDNQMEAFPASERLALHEAFAEIERAIALDGYDPEMWNLRSAWCNLLDQYQDALESADRAIALRANYAKPYINKAIAFRNLKKDTDALNAAHKALSESKQHSLTVDENHAQKLIADFSVPRSTPSLFQIQPLVKGIVKGALLTSEQAVKVWNISEVQIINRILTRSQQLRRDWSIEYLPILAEVLADFPPETVFSVICTVGKHNKHIEEHFINAALYIIAHSTNVERNDAARFLTLWLFDSLDSQKIYSLYRQKILATSAAATDELSHIDGIMQGSLEHFHPLFPQLIAKQEPITEAERQYAKNVILAQFGHEVPQTLTIIDAHFQKTFKPLPRSLWNSVLLGMLPGAVGIGWAYITYRSSGWGGRPMFVNLALMCLISLALIGSAIRVHSKSISLDEYSISTSRKLGREIRLLWSNILKATLRERHNLISRTARFLKVEANDGCILIYNTSILSPQDENELLHIIQQHITLDVITDKRGL